MNPARLLGRVLGLGAVCMVALAAPAAAHTVAGVSPTNYRSRIVAVSPRLAGVTVKLLDLGRQVELTNRSSTDVIVLGYQGEPYLRVGPDGADENRRSLTVAENRVGARPATTTTPDAAAGAANQSAPPEWRRVSSERTTRWRDHRTRWEGADPPAVRAAPDEEHVVSRWEIQLRQGDTRSLVVGRITWVPPPSPVPWLLLALGLAGATAASAFSRQWGWLLSGAVALLVAADVVNSFATAAASNPTFARLLLEVFVSGLIPAAAWVVGALAIGALQRQRATGLFAAGFAALLLTLFALPGALGLFRSQVPTAAPPGAARAASTIVLGLGLGLMVAVVVVFKRHPAMLAPPSDEPGATPTKGRQNRA